MLQRSEPYVRLRKNHLHGRYGHIFGRDVNNIFTFYKGDEVNPEYWSEKVYCADRPIKDESLDLGELEKAIQELVGSWNIPKDKQEELDDDLDLLELDENSVIASRQVYEFLEQWKEYCEPCEDINTLIGAAEKWNRRYLYACEVLQWVSNNLDEWLEEQK